MNYQITLSAGDLGLNGSFKIQKINGMLYYLDDQGRSECWLGKLLMKQDVCWAKKIREKIIEKLPKTEAVQYYVNDQILKYANETEIGSILEEIYKKTKTWNIEIEEEKISPFFPNPEGEELKFNFTAEDFDLPRSIEKIVVNGGNAVYRIENKRFSTLGDGLHNYCNNPLEKIIAIIKRKSPEIHEIEIESQISKEINNNCIFVIILLEKIYLEGLTLTFKIETSEIFAKEK